MRLWSNFSLNTRRVLIPDGPDEYVSKENTVNKNRPNNIEENKST